MSERSRPVASSSTPTASSVRSSSPAPLRLGYLVPEFPGQTHAFFWREVNALRQLGVEVQPLSTRRPVPDACRHPFAEEARRQTLYVFPPRWLRSVAFLAAHPLRLGRALGYLARLRESRWTERLRRLPLVVCAADLVYASRARGLDHLHVHSCAEAAHLAALARRLGGPSYSLTLHGDLPVYGVDHASKVRGAAFVAAVTTPLRESLVRELELAPECAPLIRMGVDTERFAPAAPRDPGSEGTRCVTVARLHPNKGHRFSLCAVRTALDSGCRLRYVIVGDGEERPALEALTNELRLGGTVEFAGAAGEADVLRALRASDVFVLPSVGRGEAAPVSVMEAMACGLAVVATRIGGTEELIRDGIDGLLVPQGDADALAKALVRLCGDPALRRRLGDEARRRAVAEFGALGQAERLRDRVLGVTGGPR